MSLTQTESPSPTTLPHFLNLHPTPQASSDNQSPMDVPRLSVYLRRHGQVSKAVKAITPEEENRNREERLKKRREQKKRENDKR